MLALLAELFEQSAWATHDVVTGVNVKDFAGDTIGVGAQEVGTGSTDFFVGNAATERGHVVVILLHFTDTGGDTGEGFQWACGDAVDANAFGAHVVCEVANGGIEGSFTDAHDVVTGNTFFTAEVGHGQNGRAAFEHGACSVCHGD